MFGKVSTWRDGDSHDDVSLALWKDLNKNNPEQVKRVMAAPECEMEPGFLGFVNTYEKLSHLIPLEAIVIDFGCYAAAQAYYFRDHRAYIGVDQYDMKYRFSFGNTLHYQMSIQDYIKELGTNHQFNTFAISNYVPQNYGNQTDKLIKETYQNCYIYYPGR